MGLFAGVFPLFMMAFGGLIAVLYVVVTVVTHPLTAFRKKRRDVPPACLQDSSLGSHGYVTANGIKFHYVSAGDTSKPLMLFVHGFPEFWFSWRSQLKEFCGDYRVVAIDMRGYGDTDKPPNKSDYRISALVQDIAELIPALGHTSCVLVAHDWGGAVAWGVASKHPELVDRLIIMNCPHSKVLRNFMKKSYRQLFMSWYMFMFQIPTLPEFLIGLRDYSLIEEAFLGNKSGVKNKALFPPEVIEAYKFTYSQPGALTFPLNYYRCLHLGREDTRAYVNKKINAPTLVIWGDSDTALSCEMADEHSSICDDLTVRHIPNCSHWVQQDAPDECNRAMREFLANKPLQQ